MSRGGKLNFRDFLMGFYGISRVFKIKGLLDEGISGKGKSCKWGTF